MTMEEDSGITRLSRLALHEPQTASVVKLKFVDGLNNREIAKALQISPDSVKKCMQIAKDWFRSDLSGHTGSQEQEVPGLRIYQRAITDADQDRYIEWIKRAAIWNPDFSRWRCWINYKYVYKEDVLLRATGSSLTSLLAELARLGVPLEWCSRCRPNRAKHSPGTAWSP